MNLQSVLQETLHEAIRQQLQGFPTYINCNGALTHQKDTDCLIIEQTNDEIIIKNNKNETCFADIAQKYRNTTIQDISKDRGNKRLKSTDNIGSPESGNIVDGMESDFKRE